MKPEINKGWTAIANALSIFYGDHEGDWPPLLEALVPNYLSEIPEDGVTGSRKVVLTFDGTGGWIYDKVDGKVRLNHSSAASFLDPYAPVKDWRIHYFIKTPRGLKANTDGKVMLRELPSAEMIIPFLWSEDKNVDSDGEEEGDEKIYKYLQNRDKPEEYLVIARIKKDKEAYVFRISSELEYIVARTAFFFATVLKGKVGLSEEGPFSSPDTLLDKIGKDFNLDEAFKRVKESSFWPK